MRYRTAFAFLFLAYIFVKIFSHVFSFIGLADFSLSFVLVSALMYRNDKLIPPVVAAAFFCCINDFMFGQFPGVNILFIMITVLLVLYVKNIVNIENPLIVIATLSVFLIFNRFLYWFFYFIAGSPYGIYEFIKFIPLYLLVNLLISILVYLFLLSKFRNGNVRKQGY